MHFDVFNGDADGICALIQLRLDRPLEAKLVTGIKRDIQLLDKVIVNSGDSLTVLDISLEKNSLKVNEFLNLGATIFYADHHQTGDIPKHPNFKALIDTNSAVCTSLLINNYLGNKYPLWAVTAAYGDNLTNSAEKLASTLQISESELSLLHKLGVYINYNGYGNCIEDLHFYPDDLYKELVPYTSPIDFIKTNRKVYEKLELGYCDDMAKAEQIKPEFENEKVAVVLLPDQSWARRVSGVYGNALANQNPLKAHAVLSENNTGGYLVSVRAPLSFNDGAGEFCSRFSSGGGRKSAAGINHLPKQQFDFFVREFDAFFSKWLN
jgi:hypothetical protein